jgi:hypothetical protein
MTDNNNIHVPSYNLVLRNPNYGLKEHPHALIKVMLIQKIDDPSIDPSIEKLAIESGFDIDAEDIYLNTIIDKDDKGFSSVINGDQRVNVVRRFILNSWKVEEFN